MKNKFPAGSSRKSDSVHVNARGKIKAGICMYAKKNVSLEKLLSYLKKCSSDLKWDDPNVELRENEVMQVFFPLYYPDEELEYASNESVSEYCDMLTSIDTESLKELLQETEDCLNEADHPELGLITMVFTSSSTFPNN